MLLLYVLAGCRQPRTPRTIERSFYYWKSVFLLKPHERQVLEELHITKLYIKYFDVSWNGETNQPMPIATIRFPHGAASIASLSIVPVIFITNDCMEKMQPSQVEETAAKIIRLTSSVSQRNGIKPSREIQIDCDWTERTRANYFSLLEVIRRLTRTENRELSATIRLYQCKYARLTGVPPVDRGLLMCYNMGNLKDPSTGNSILQASELKKYSNALSSYPLPLDVALPLFDWTVLFRNNAYGGLISGLAESDFNSHPGVKSAGPYHTILSDASIRGYEFKAGDLLRNEQVKYDELVKACKILDQELKTQQVTVSLYHLDSLTLSKYSLHELESVFDHLH